MNRRRFLDISTKAAFVSPFLASASAFTAGRIDINRLSSPGKHHFFGYYGINPWHSSGKYHLALETDFDNRMPAPTDLARVGYINAKDHKFNKLAETPAFNFSARLDDALDQ